MPGAAAAVALVPVFLLWTTVATDAMAPPHSLLVDAKRSTLRPTLAPRPDYTHAFARNSTRRTLYVAPYAAAWSPCMEQHCHVAYHQCIEFFGGDACLCYPGLLRCASLRCGVDSVSAVFDACATGQMTFNSPTTTARCALSCSPSSYPTKTWNEPTADDSDELDAAMTFTVTATLEVDAMSKLDLAGAAFELADAMAQVVNVPNVTLDNITFSAVTATADGTAQVQVILACPSPDAMNATMAAIESMVGVAGPTALGAALVDFSVLFHASQLQVQSVQEAVAMLPPPVHPHPTSTPFPRTATPGPPLQPPPEPTEASGQLALPTAAIVGIVFGAAAVIVSAISFGCWWRRRNGAHSGYVLHGV